MTAHHVQWAGYTTLVAAGAILAALQGHHLLGLLLAGCALLSARLVAR